MIVDDDRDFVDCMTIRLRESCRVAVAYSAAEAISAITTKHPDLVLLDVVLPDQSGIDVLRKIKAIRRALPIIILTGHSTQDLVIEALREHADDYLRKGTGIEEIMCRIQKLLARRPRARCGAAKKALAKTKNSHIRKEIEFLCENYMDSIDLTVAGEAIGLSPKYLSRLFVQETGRKVMRFLMELRMERAKELLLTTRQKVNEIAPRVGYSYATHFRRAFRRIYGCSPIECRRRHDTGQSRPKRLE